MGESITCSPAEPDGQLHSDWRHRHERRRLHPTRQRHADFQYGFSATHTYKDDNPSSTASDSYAIKVTVADDDTGSAPASTSVTVNNLAPTLSGLSATPIVENGTTTLSGIIADAGVLDTFTVEIDWDNDGVYEQTFTNVSVGAFSYTHQYFDDSPTGTPVDNLPIRIRVTDDDTGVTTASRSPTPIPR